MPEVDEVAARYEGRAVVVAVGTGSEERIAKLRAEKALSLPVPRATDPWRETLGVVAFPETLFIDAQGRVAERLQGGQEGPYFAARIDALLAEAAALAPSGDPAAEPAAEASSQPAQPAPAASAESGSHGFIPRIVYRLHRLTHRGGGEASPAD